MLKSHRIISRYAQGANSVSTHQLPGESDEGREFRALKTISKDSSDLNAAVYSLEVHDVDKDSDYIDPINWFGILVPQSLKTARERYEKAIELVVELANIEHQLKVNYELLDKLKTIKVSFENTEE